MTAHLQHGVAQELRRPPLRRAKQPDRIDCGIRVYYPKWYDTVGTVLSTLSLVAILFAGLYTLRGCR